LDDGPINVPLADDDEGFLTSLRELVDRQPELRVVAVARNGIEAIERADQCDPDAAVIDLHADRPAPPGPREPLPDRADRRLRQRAAPCGAPGRRRRRLAERRDGRPADRRLTRVRNGG
jgi:DNA-binding NarL/FixJ family response regulator